MSKKLTLEHRKKLSEAKKKFYAENGNIIGFKKGNRLAESPRAVATRFKKGQTSPNKGVRTPWTVGENHYNWKGGVSSLKKTIRDCFKYRQWRSDVFSRDNFTCQSCGARGVYLEAHHALKYFSQIIEEYAIKTLEDALGCEELWNINNGQTLCRDCHNKTKHGKTK